MILIIVSIILGVISSNIGFMIHSSDYMVAVYGFVGFLTPSLFMIEQIYRESKKNKTQEN